MRRSFALTSCAAVSRKFRARARTCIFRTVTFDVHSRTAAGLCALLADDDDLRSSVREIRFDGQESYRPNLPWADKSFRDLLPQLTNLTTLVLSSFETTKFLACFPADAFRFIKCLQLNSCMIQPPPAAIHGTIPRVEVTRVRRMVPLPKPTGL
ncbi:hypothetical protein CPB85DRAFT_1009268 [Mucidula mucida]|nr:hypothetical protein CPB85DRAFT_1009268 [Mucidula mucida]